MIMHTPMIQRIKDRWKTVCGPSYQKHTPDSRLLYPGFVITVSLLSILLAQASPNARWKGWNFHAEHTETVNKAIQYVAENKTPLTETGEMLTHYRFEAFGATDPDEVDVNAPMIALTFDDGPNPSNTIRVLDVLSANYSHATFFVVGTNAEQYQDTLKAISAAGCEIGNHTYNHANLTTIRADEVAEQLEKVNRAVRKATGEGTTVIRPPYGAYDEELLAQLDAPVVLWDLDTEDWSSRDAQKVVEAVLTKVKDGDIVLMHDIYESTAEAVEIMVPKLKEQGFQIMSVSEMAEYKGKSLELGKAYGGFKSGEQ